MQQPTVGNRRDGRNPFNGLHASTVANAEFGYSYLCTNPGDWFRSPGNLIMSDESEAGRLSYLHSRYGESTSVSKT